MNNRKESLQIMLAFCVVIFGEEDYCRFAAVRHTIQTDMLYLCFVVYGAPLKDSSESQKLG